MANNFDVSQIEKKTYNLLPLTCVYSSLTTYNNNSKFIETSCSSLSIDSLL